MISRDRSDWNRVFLGGVVAGLIGGIVIAVVMLIANIAAGRDLWMAMKGAGTPFLGERAGAPGFDAVAVLVGVLSHFAVSIVWGLLFAMVADGLSKRATVLAGAFFGVLVWIGMYYIVLPILGMGQVARSAPVGPVILEHVIFGLGLGVGYLPYQHPRARPAMGAHQH